MPAFRAAAAVVLVALAATPVVPFRELSVAHAQVDAQRITLADFKKMFDANQVVVVDTRDLESYRAGHIPGAVLVPQNAAQARAAEFKALGKTVVTYCT